MVSSKTNLENIQKNRGGIALPNLAREQTSLPKNGRFTERGDFKARMKLWFFFVKWEGNCGFKYVSYYLNYRSFLCYSPLFPDISALKVSFAFVTLVVVAVIQVFWLSNDRCSQQVSK